VFSHRKVPTHLVDVARVRFLLPPRISCPSTTAEQCRVVVLLLFWKNRIIGTNAWIKCCFFSLWANPSFSSHIFFFFFTALWCERFRVGFSHSPSPLFPILFFLNGSHLVTFFATATVSTEAMYIHTPFMAENARRWTADSYVAYLQFPSSRDAPSPHRRALGLCALISPFVAQLGRLVPFTLRDRQAIGFRCRRTRQTCFN